MKTLSLLVMMFILAAIVISHNEKKETVKKFVVDNEVIAQVYESLNNKEK